MAWDCFNFDEPRLPLINHIEDRDLWRFKLPHTARDCGWPVFSSPTDFETWDGLMQPNRLDLLNAEGAAIERKHHQDIANTLAVTRREMVIGGWLVPVANLPLNDDIRRRARALCALRPWCRRVLHPTIRGLLLGYARRSRVLPALSR